VLWEAGHYPETGIQIDGVKLAFSRVFASSNRKYTIGYSSAPGENVYYPRLYYKSRSDGGWRATPGYYYYFDGNKTEEAYDKGDFGNERYGEYVQATKPLEDVGALLDSLEGWARGHEQVLSPEELHNFHILMQKSSLEQESGRRFESEVRLSKVLGYGLGSYVVGQGWRNPKNARLCRIETAHQQLPDGFKPDFSVAPARGYKIQHSMLGECKVDVYPAVYNTRPAEWHIARDTSNRHVWIDRIVPTGVLPTTYGTAQEVIIGGILSAKPLDYVEQTAGMEMPVDVLPVEGYGGRYADLSPTLNRQPWLREYRYYQLDGQIAYDPADSARWERQNH
jgi:hypothetical protein